MTEEQYQAGLADMRRDWGRLSPDPASPGILRAANDSTTGILAGKRAPILAEIVNRALEPTEARGG